MSVDTWRSHLYWCCQVLSPAISPTCAPLKAHHHHPLDALIIFVILVVTVTIVVAFAVVTVVDVIAVAVIDAVAVVVVVVVVVVIVVVVFVAISVCLSSTRPSLIILFGNFYLSQPFIPFFSFLFFSLSLFPLLSFFAPFLRLICIFLFLNFLHF